MKRSVPRFIVVLDQANAEYPLPVVASSAISGGADLVQIREKELDGNTLRSLVEGVIEAVGDPSRVSINSHAELAKELGTSLHLPERTLGDRRTLPLEERALLGRSIHSASRDWSADEVDYLILGNLLETAGKPGKPGLGRERFANIARRYTVPVLAIGGIRPETVSVAFEAGAYGVAVSSFVNAAADPEWTALQIRNQIDL